MVEHGMLRNSGLNNLYSFSCQTLQTTNAPNSTLKVWTISASALRNGGVPFDTSWRERIHTRTTRAKGREFNVGDLLCAAARGAEVRDVLSLSHSFSLSHSLSLSLSCSLGLAASATMVVERSGALTEAASDTITHTLFTQWVAIVRHSPRRLRISLWCCWVARGGASAVGGGNAGWRQGIEASLRWSRLLSHARCYWRCARVSRFSEKGRTQRGQECGRMFFFFLSGEEGKSSKDVVPDSPQHWIAEEPTD